MRFIFLCSIAVLVVQLGCAAPRPVVTPAPSPDYADNASDIDYEPIPKNLFPGFEHAALIVDYYYSTGISLGDRYNYEIIVTDRTVCLSFDSPGTESYKKVEFGATRELTAGQVRGLARAIDSAHLKQLRPAIPRPTFTGHTREVLIVRSKRTNVAGGRFNSNIFGEVTQQEMESQIAREQAETSTIGGNFDAVIKAVERLFPELPHLLSQTEGGEAPATGAG